MTEAEGGAPDEAYPSHEQYGVAFTPVEAVQLAPSPEDRLRLWLWLCAGGWLLCFPLSPFLALGPLLIALVLVARDYDAQSLHVLSRSRFLLSGLDRQAKTTWVLGGFFVPFVYLPMYAIKRNRLARIARSTIDYDWSLDAAEHQRVRSGQRWHVPLLWVLVLGSWIAPVVLFLVYLFFNFGPVR